MPISDREQQRLEWAAMMGKWPKELHPLLERYPNYICYRVKKAHCKIAYYEFGGTLDAPELYFNLMQGADSIFPGAAITHVDHRLVRRCDCGHYEDASRAKVETAKARYENAVMRAKKVLN